MNTAQLALGEQKPQPKRNSNRQPLNISFTNREDFFLTGVPKFNHILLLKRGLWIFCEVSNGTEELAIIVRLFLRTSPGLC